MNKVITINLNGRAYQLEEAGFHSLQSYLDQAASKLGGNPDKDEVMADFEQAIADKCDKFLNDHKTVVTAKEIEEIIKEMGPVNDSEEEKKAGAENAGAKTEAGKGDAPKRLFQIHEGAMLSGVCMGLAAYFNMDVSLIRIIFVALAIITHGAWVLVYIVMALVIPYANTSEQQAEARGVPFNAQELLQNAKKKYAQFDRKYWRDQKKTWKKHAKYAQEQRKQWEEQWMKRKPDLTMAGNGFLNVVSGIAMALISLVWVWAIISLVTTGFLFGAAFGGVPLWVLILIITCLYNILLMPLRAMRWQGNRQVPYEYSQYATLDGIMWMMIFVIIGWVIWQYVPQAQELWARFIDWTHQWIH